MDPGVISKAVEIRRGCKSYNGGENILNNINVKVDYGTVYGILGASGCGKTTLLSCILGLERLESGKIFLFGEVKNEQSRIPPTLVGYMPQESVLYVLFSIYEALNYYGMLYGLRREQISSRISHLQSILQLPQLSRIIKTLSGGQARRLSLALALIHEPKLLILDEPSVGLDPVLWESIWHHLRELVTKEAVTIIVTTHFITESVNFDKVGIMRNGKMIAEDSPKNLLNTYQQNNMEEVVMELCRKDEDESAAFVGEANNNNNFIKEELSEERRNLTNSRNDQIIAKTTKSFDMILAIGYKNLLFYKRDWMFTLTFLLVIPLNSVMQDTILGKNPKGLILNFVVGNDADNLNQNYCQSFEFRNSHKLNTSCFGNTRFPICNLLQRLSSHDIKIVQLQNEEAALGVVENGGAIGYMKFDSNYSSNLQNRLIFRNFASNESVLGSEVKIRLDMSSTVSSNWLRALILHEWRESMKEVVRGCEYDERIVELPLHVKSLYSDVNSKNDYISFCRPSIVMMLIFIMGKFTGAFYVLEKRNGLQSRGTVAGVKLSHQIIASLLTDSFMLLLQIVTIFAMQTFLYGAVIKGSLTLCLLIVYLTAISGLALSIVISVWVENEMQMFYIMLTLTLAHMVASGGIWPLECVAWGMRYFCYCLPITLPLASLRAVMFYGWGMCHPRVLAGLGSSLIWIFGCGLLTAIASRKMK